MNLRADAIALQYHASTKHHFHRFAASPGYLDWATQPDPFRRFAGARLLNLPRKPVGAGIPYERLFDGRASPLAIDDDSVAELLRCSMGLSAWKQFRESRWALRVNPSSGNLHPTEAYVVRDGRVWHYAPREHALEERCVVADAAWSMFTQGRPGFLVALTSIHWREAWKYGERAFRYCQHDAGHALGALRFAAAMLGWQLALLVLWSDDQIAAMTGIDRDADYEGAEDEEPDGIAVITPADSAPWVDADPTLLVDAARAATWHGTANRLSAGHREWPSIDHVAVATRYPGLGIRDSEGESRDSAVETGPRFLPSNPGSRIPSPGDAREIILQRRSAVAFDARSSLPRETFVSMLRHLDPGAPPWDAIHPPPPGFGAAGRRPSREGRWPPQVHLIVFVHRVGGLTPGVYAYLRDLAVLDEWRAALRPDFLWDNASHDSNGRLFLLVPVDVKWPANRVSCDQDIASDGFFSLGMVARVEPSLAERGEWFYRRLFWECGLIGQVLYLEAEAAGARGTGIGCFYDDAVHDLVGLSGHTWQSLYHFSMGMPVDDSRLTTEPGYPWEAT